MTRLRKFLLLPAADRALFGKATVLLWGIRLALWLLPFQNLRNLLVHVTQAPTGWHRADQSSPDRIAWAVVLASRYVPQATCLTQALAAQVLLGREGHPAYLRIGVARSERGQFHAHAWVETQGKVVIGASEVERYTPLMALGGASR
jgi:hypothetical protein